MNWASVKNLLILMLVLANVFLLYNIFVQNRTQSYISESELRDAAGLISERGQEIGLSGIPLGRFDMAIYESSYPGDESYYKSVAARISGDAEMRVYPMPDGSTRVSAGQSGESVNFEFTKDFSFVFWNDDNPESAAYTDITADDFAEKIESGEELPRTRLAALSKLAIAFLGTDDDETGLSALIEGGYRDDSGNSYVVVSQRLSGVEVFRHRVVCVFEGGELVAAVGRWYFGKTGASYDYEFYDQINILFANLRDLESERESADEKLPRVVSMSSCVAAYMDPDKTALYFIPAWEITHDDGRVIVYNAAQNTRYYSGETARQ